MGKNLPKKMVMAAKMEPQVGVILGRSCSYHHKCYDNLKHLTLHSRTWVAQYRADVSVDAYFGIYLILSINFRSSTNISSYLSFWDGLIFLPATCIDVLKY